MPDRREEIGLLVPRHASSDVEKEGIRRSLSTLPGRFATPTARPISVVAEDGFAPIAPIEEMIKGAGKFDARFASY